MFGYQENIIASARAFFLFVLSKCWNFVPTNTYTNMVFKKLIILLGVFFSCATSFALPDGEGGTPIPILKDNSLEHAVPPKSPAQIPMDCVYYSSLTSIVTTFHRDLVTVSVTVENQTTGDNYQVKVNALAGPMILPISGTSGHWRIFFLLTNGEKYSGDFWI